MFNGGTDRWTWQQAVLQFQYPLVLFHLSSYFAMRLLCFPSTPWWLQCFLHIPIFSFLFFKKEVVIEDWLYCKHDDSWANLQNWLFDIKYHGQRTGKPLPDSWRMWCRQRYTLKCKEFAFHTDKTNIARTSNS